MKNLKSRYRSVLIINLIFGLLLILIYAYKPTYFMLDTPSYKVNSISLNSKLLIVKQSSPFKDSITAVVSAHYKSANIVVEVINMRSLQNIEATDFDAILILHRWEARAAPDAIQAFMDKNSSLQNKMVVLTTSWNGLEKTEDTDAITGASIVDNVPIFANKIIKKLDPLLKHKK